MNTAVVNMSKVKISKAIHNSKNNFLYNLIAVVNMSKVKISKAIHNAALSQPWRGRAVVNMSKVKISKAIHNGDYPSANTIELLSICQR